MLNYFWPRCLFFAFAISAFWLVVSCTPPNLDVRTETSVTSLESKKNPLDGTLWELKAIESGEVTLSMPDKPRLFAEFINGQLSLEGGCNAIGGHYLVENNHIKITLAEGTLVECPDMQEIMRVEKTFLEAMPTFETYTITDGELRIRFSEGEILFRLVSK